MKVGDYVHPFNGFAEERIVSKIVDDKLYLKDYFDDDIEYIVNVTNYMVSEAKFHFGDIVKYVGGNTFIIPNNSFHVLGYVYFDDELFSRTGEKEYTYSRDVDFDMKGVYDKYMTCCKERPYLFEESTLLLHKKVKR